MYGSPTSTEVAASGSISLPRTEQTQTVHVWSGVPTSWTIAPVTVHDGTESWIRLQVRRSLTTNLLLAVSVSRATSSVSGTVKSDFSSGQQTVYEERKSDALDRVENGLLAGLSWTISEAALISLEYGVSSEERTSTTYNISSSVLRTDGSPFQIGDQQSKNESKYVWQYFRIGSEMELVEDIKIRLGGEAGWSLGDYSYFYDLGDGSWKETGLTDSFIAVTGGCSWYTGGFRLDYSLGLLPGSGFIPHTEQFSVGTLQRNVIFRHNVTLTYEL